MGRGWGSSSGEDGGQACGHLVRPTLRDEDELIGVHVALPRQRARELRVLAQIWVEGVGFEEGRVVAIVPYRIGGGGADLAG